MADSQERTEKPTQKRIEKAREEGKVVSSRQLVVSLQVLIVYVFFFQDFGESSQRLLTIWIQSFREVFVDPAPHLAVLKVLGPTKENLLPWLGLMVAVIALTSLATQLAGSQGAVRLQNLSPQPNKLFSAAKLLEGYKSAHQRIPLFTGAVVLFLAASLWPSYAIWEEIPGLRRVAPLAQTARYGGAFLDAFRYATGLFLLVGLVDFGWKFKSMHDNLKMTKQEVKEESKDANGNPLIKSALRRRMKALLANRMMQKIPEATVVVVNPTHFAVALHYDADSSDAPMVTAKGLDFLALRMRRKAEECNVPVVENPPLAQALYKSAEVGQRIPVELYRAVAEVLAYVFRVLGRRGPAMA